MHKLAKGLKKKKKQKKGKKGAEEDEFDPEELERYRRERAEAQQKAGESGEAASAGSDEWKKFEALTAGVDSILKKTQGDLDRIKSTSFFQRKVPLANQKEAEKSAAAAAAAEQQKKKKRTKKWVDFDQEGNPIEQDTAEEEKEKKGIKDKEEKSILSEEGFVEVSEDEDDLENSAEEDIFDTTYVDVLQNIEVQLAYIPESPTQEEVGDDPFDTTSADKVLKTVDKKGNKLVSLGNAVEVLSGRIEHVSTCKIGRSRKTKNRDLLLGDFDGVERSVELVTNESSTDHGEPKKTLLDDDSDLPDVPVDLTNLSSVLPRPVTPEIDGAVVSKEPDQILYISEFEDLKERTTTILEGIPDLDDAEFDLSTISGEPVPLEETEDPFSEKESNATVFQADIIEAIFETATFVDEEDPFDTTFADNIVPSKTELRFIEQELEEFPVSQVSISLTDPAGLNRDYETGLIQSLNGEQEPGLNFSLQPCKKDLLGGSVTDLSQLTDRPIEPVEEITYVDPFDTSAVEELPPGKTELKFLEKELLGETEQKLDTLLDDDFDPRKDEEPSTIVPTKPQASSNFQVNFDDNGSGKNEEPANPSQSRKSSRPEALGLASTKVVAFELPTPSQRPDLLKTSEEEKAIPSKPLTPYCTQKSLEECLPEVDIEEVVVDPFDTSFVTKVAPGKIELKLIESELLEEQEPHLSHSLSDHDFNPRAETEQPRRFSDFSATSTRPKSLKIVGLPDSFTEEIENLQSQSELDANDEAHRKKLENKRQESLLDVEFEVDAKLLTPKIESKVLEEEELSYSDPFDTSIATNVLPGKAELKILESELNQITEKQVRLPSSLILDSQNTKFCVAEEEDDFDPRGDEVREAEDFLSLEGQDSGAKALTPLQNKEFLENELTDPFDTSFATINPGRTELKLLESEFV